MRELGPQRGAACLWPVVARSTPWPNLTIEIEQALAQPDPPAASTTKQHRLVWIAAVAGVLLGPAACGNSPTLLYAGVAPGFPGLYQVNAQIPAGTRSGSQPLQITQNGFRQQYRDRSGSVAPRQARELAEKK
jgi:hypothetical protein